MTAVVLLLLACCAISAAASGVGAPVTLTTNQLIAILFIDLAILAAVIFIGVVAYIGSLEAARETQLIREESRQRAVARQKARKVDSSIAAAPLAVIPRVASSLRGGKFFAVTKYDMVGKIALVAIINMSRVLCVGGPDAAFAAGRYPVKDIIESVENMEKMRTFKRQSALETLG